MKDTLNSNYFTCPDGDVHRRLPVQNIWVEDVKEHTNGGRTWKDLLFLMLGYEFKEYYTVNLALYDERTGDTIEWYWDRDTKEEAEIARDYLIKELVHTDD
jgi:hypothetical protein